MKHIKSFNIFESSNWSKLTPEMEAIADAMLVSNDIIIETDKSKMSEWVIERGLQRAADEYLDSDEFREFTEASVEETDEYREKVEAGGDPEKVLQQLTDKSISDQTYWDEFLEEGGYATDAMDEISSEIKYVNPKRNEDFIEYPSKWETVSREDFPTIDVYGSAYLMGSRFKGSFLPFRIRSVNQIDLDDVEIPDINEDFQTFWIENLTGEFTIDGTNLIALENKVLEPENFHTISAETGFFARENPRLISLVGLEECDEIDIEDTNGVPPEKLKESIGLLPGSEESVEYYISLLSLPEFLSFDDEQVEFVLSRIGGKEGIQKMINEKPEKMAVLLKSVWKKIKSIPKFSGLEYPEGFGDKADLISDLDVIGL